MELVFEKNNEFDKAYSVTAAPGTLKIPVEGGDLYLEGSFYYQMKEGKPVKLEAGKFGEQLSRAFSEGGLQPFIESVEGDYAGIHVDRKNSKITVFSDKLKRKEIYYCEDAGTVTASTDLKNLRKKSKGYNHEAMASALYLYIPKKHTLFSNVFRLRYNEALELAPGRWGIVKYEEEPLKIEDYSDADLKAFGELVENAIVSRASDEMNIVQMSGGWDSSFMVSVLTKHFGTAKVKGVVAELILPDGVNYNPYEIAKTKKIADYFGVQLDVVKVHFGDKGLVGFWESDIRGKLLEQGIYAPFSFIQFKMARHIKDKYGEGAVVFNGEACDSIMNLGFAQFASIPHENKGFGEYSDKMLCYMYGPTFFRKVLDGTYKDDLVFRIFRDYRKELEFIDADKLPVEDRVFEYLFSFMYAPGRLPFAKLEKSNFIEDGKMADFKKWLRTEYFDDTIKGMKPETAYYWLLRMYVDFHWQSPTNIRKVTESMRNMRLPYMDYNLVKFFMRMPEKWGRGLEINNVKYPLKRLIREGLADGTIRYPLDVIGSTIPHAYSAADLNRMPYEFVMHSPLARNLIDKCGDSKCEEFFPAGYFNTDAVKAYINYFKGKGEERKSQLNFRLLTFMMTAE
jgi:hypothetical protein